MLTSPTLACWLLSHWCLCAVCASASGSDTHTHTHTWGPLCACVQIRLEADADSTAVLMEAHTAAARQHEQLRADLEAQHAARVADMRRDLERAQSGWAACRAEATAALPTRVQVADVCTQTAQIVRAQGVEASTQACRRPAAVDAGTDAGLGVPCVEAGCQCGPPGCLALMDACCQAGAHAQLADADTQVGPASVASQAVQASPDVSATGTATPPLPQLVDGCAQAGAQHAPSYAAGVRCDACTQAAAAPGRLEAGTQAGGACSVQEAGIQHCPHLSDAGVQAVAPQPPPPPALCNAHTQASSLPPSATIDAHTQASPAPPPTVADAHTQASPAPSAPAVDAHTQASPDPPTPTTDTHTQASPPASYDAHTQASAPLCATCDASTQDWAGPMLPPPSLCSSHSQTTATAHPGNTPTAVPAASTCHASTQCTAAPRRDACVQAAAWPAGASTPAVAKAAAGRPAPSARRSSIASATQLLHEIRQNLTRPCSLPQLGKAAADAAPPAAAGGSLQPALDPLACAATPLAATHQQGTPQAPHALDQSCTLPASAAAQPQVRPAPNLRPQPAACAQHCAQAPTTTGNISRRSSSGSSGSVGHALQQGQQQQPHCGPPSAAGRQLPATSAAGSMVHGTARGQLEAGSQPLHAAAAAAAATSSAKMEASAGHLPPPPCPLPQTQRAALLAPTPTLHAAHAHASHPTLHTAAPQGSQAPLATAPASSTLGQRSRVEVDEDDEVVMESRPSTPRNPVCSSSTGSSSRGSPMEGGRLEGGCLEVLQGAAHSTAAGGAALLRACSVCGETSYGCVCACLCEGACAGTAPSECAGMCVRVVCVQCTV